MHTRGQHFTLRVMFMGQTGWAGPQVADTLLCSSFTCTRTVPDRDRWSLLRACRTGVTERLATLTVTAATPLFNHQACPLTYEWHQNGRGGGRGSSY